MVGFGPTPSNSRLAIVGRANREDMVESDVDFLLLKDQEFGIFAEAWANIIVRDVVISLKFHP